MAMAFATASASASSLSLTAFSLPLPQSLHRPSPSLVLHGATSSFPRPLRCGWGAVVRCAKRTGKRRYPSEKKRLNRRQQELLRQAAPEEGRKGRESGYWRLSKLAVPARDDPGKDFTGISLPLLQAIAKAIKFPVPSMLPDEAFTVIRKSFDARKVLKEPQFTYIVDMDVKKILDIEPRAWDFIARLEPKLGAVEYMPEEKLAADLVSMLNVNNKGSNNVLGIRDTHSGMIYHQQKKPRVAVIGSGPSGLFASLVLGELGAEVTLLERGQPVEQRGRDIGALAVRRILQSESNFCFGEGGAGTWSDGKLMTRIGRNTDGVQAVGLRIEHPQELINSIQYSELAAEVQRGRGRIPVADYKIAKYVGERDAANEIGIAEPSRSCYSFCMCPGGQVVPTSTNPSELCINGMSFSRRASKWANSALVVTVSSHDFKPFQSHGPLAGVEFQREFERRAAMMGGGDFVVPAQCVTDFISNRLSVTTLPPSSYRLGVRPSNLHELFPPYITEALQQSIIMIDREMPGFVSSKAVLHGVETRTSSPLQISRHGETYESTSLRGLYPIGEGAGYAGGILSAAVDGMYCGFALAKQLSLFHGDIESFLGKAQKQTGFVKY
ncbi:uncharacterized protein [Miscanthus floridulus]|uniref:uncharacterized protein isoform X3 n=1 Tax=Miscanthus floridulus TaxID=154761 RepID=UPI0034577C40